jgi:hypothetical protein
MSTFSPDCTLPEGTVNYVSSPDIRGTLDVLWSCLSILLLCTWTVQHLNVPFKRNPPTKLAQLLQWLLLVGEKAFWMLVNLIFPEWMLGKALLDLVSARYCHKAMEPYAEIDGREWTLSHSFFANLGGFAIVFSDDTPVVYAAKESVINVDGSDDATIENPSLEGTNPTDPGCPDLLSGQVPLIHRQISGSRSYLTRFERPSPSDDNIWKPNAKNYALANQAIDNATQSVLLSRFNACCRNIVSLQGNVWILDAAQLTKARKFGIIDTLPDVTEEQITNQTKGDTIVKALALGQSLWMIIQVISRRATGLNSSQLEIMAVAFSVVAFLTYLCLLYKPQGIECVTPIYASRYASAEEFLEIGLEGPESFLQGPQTPYIGNHSLPQFGPHNGVLSRATVSLVGGVGGLVFGAIHCAAWSYQFPTEIERLLWRIASVVACAIPAITTLAFARQWHAILLALVKQKPPSAPKTKNKSGNFLDRFAAKTKDMPLVYILFLGMYGSVIFLAAVVYAASRLYLIVESFRSLCFLPPSAFSTINWPISLPHVE